MSLEMFIRDLIRQAVTEALADVRARSFATNSNSTPEVFITLADAATRAAVSKGTVRNWVKAGKLRTYGTGRVLRIKREELDAWLARGDAGDDQPTVAEQVDIIMARKIAKSSRG